MKTDVIGRSTTLVLDSETGIPERGVLGKEGIYFPTVSEFVNRYLFNVHFGAVYHCDYPYRIDRPCFDSSIMFHMLEGELCFEYRDRVWVAGVGDVVLLSGAYPNCYYAQRPVTFAFVHFSGNITDEYIEYIYRSRGSHFTGDAAKAAGAHMAELMKLLKSGNGDGHIRSLHLHSIFTHLVADHEDGCSNEKIAGAVKFIDEHYAEPLQVNEIAARFNYSQFHFSRLFREELGLAPHQYLQNRRILEAKRLLTNSRATIETIAEHCGFSSSSHFIRAFRKIVDLTPNEFRKVPY